MTESIVPLFAFRLYRLLIAIACIVLAAPSLRSQQPTPTPASPAPAATTPLPTLVYDVASIHKFKPDGDSMMMFWKTAPDGFTATHMQVQSFICNAYGVHDYQVIGGPSWVSSDYYDLTAKMDDSATQILSALSVEQKKLVRQQMMQALLADRFKLVIHHETRQFPIYALIVAKSGPKLQASKPDDDYKNGIPAVNGQHGGKGMMRFQVDSAGATMMTGQGHTLDSVATQLAGQLHSKVENRTGIKGEYDFTLRFSMNDAVDASTSDPSIPSLFTAVQEQLGLKLEATKGPVDVIVIDHIELPSEN